jgi:hypothetical protein
VSVAENRVQRGAHVPTQPQMSADDARELTEEVRHDFGVLWNKVLDLYERGAHIALNYDSWGAYWSAEFGMSGARGEQLVRAGRVARELERAGLPLPANDSTARQLLPVLRSAPEQLPELWQKALDAHGTPNTRQVRELALPFRSERAASARGVSKRARTKRVRGLVAHSLESARVGVEQASDALEHALATGPDAATLREWHEHASLIADVSASMTSQLHDALEAGP